MLKVMLIDDEPFILQGLQILVDWNKEGYEIVAALSNGKEALDYLKENEEKIIENETLLQFRCRMNRVVNNASSLIIVLNNKVDFDNV